jgi:hypothetical protein
MIYNLIDFLSELQTTDLDKRSGCSRESRALSNALITPLSQAYSDAFNARTSIVSGQRVAEIYDHARSSAKSGLGWACPSGVAKRYLYTAGILEDSGVWLGSKLHMLLINEQYGLSLDEVDTQLTQVDRDILNFVTKPR